MRVVRSDSEDALKICTLNNIEIHLAGDGEICAYKCGPTGFELGDELRQDASDKTFRLYWCTNCGWSHDGAAEDSFDAVRKHLGKMHEFRDPFPAI